MMRKAALLTVSLALAGCGDSEPAPAPSGESARPLTNPLIERFDDVVLVVDPNGLGGYQQEPLRFGAAREDVEAIAVEAFGSAGETSRNEECGAGPMEFSQYGPLSIAYQDGKFAGWFLRDGAGVVTSDGVRPGVTTIEGLKAERDVRELETTLPGEFEYTTADFGTIRGFAEDGKITALQAGLSCFFR